MRTFISAMCIALAACATPTAKENTRTIDQFAADLSGKELRLQFPSAPDASALSGARDPVFGYAGLKQAPSPAATHCEANGSILHSAAQQSFSKTGPQLPTRLQCKMNDTLVWQLGLHYLEKNIIEDKHRRTILLTPQASVLAPTENEAFQPGLNKPPKAMHRPLSRAKQSSEHAEKPLGKPKQAPKTEEVSVFKKI